MNLSEAQKNEVKDFAGRWFSPGQIATVLELDFALIKAQMKAEAGDFYTAYQTGKLLSTAKLHSAINKQAEIGSSPAQTLAFKLLTQQSYNEKIKK